MAAERLEALPAIEAALWRELATAAHDQEHPWRTAVLATTDGQVGDAVYDEVRGYFDDKALADLTLAIATINAWNRLAIAARTTPGTYQPASAGAGS